MHGVKESMSYQTANGTRYCQVVEQKELNPGCYMKDCKNRRENTRTCNRTIPSNAFNIIPLVFNLLETSI